MKLKFSSPFIFTLLFFLISCNEEPLFQDNTSLVNENVVKVNTYYKNAVNNSKDPIKAMPYIDSALVISKVNAIDSLHLKCLAYKSYLLSENKNFEKAIVYSDSLLQKAEHLKDTFYIGRAYFKKGLYNLKLDRKIKSFESYAQSKKYFLAIKDSNQVAGKLLNISYIQKDIGDYGAAKETVIEGLKFQRNNTTKKYISKLYNILSIVKKEEKEYTKSLEYKDKAIQLLRNSVDTLKSKDSISLIKLLNSKAVINIKKGDYVTALGLLDQIYTFPVINLKSNLDTKALVLDNLGVVNGKLNNKEAESVLLEAYGIRDSLKLKTGLNASYIHLCEFYINENKPDVALSWAERAYTNAQEIKSLVSQKEALHYITELQNVPKKKHVKSYKKVTDSLTSLSNHTRSIYAEEKYEAHENKIKALQSKKAEDDAKFQKNIYLIVGFTLVLLLLLYKYYSDKIKNEKNKKEQLVTAYTTETRISKRVHDELANDVYSVMTRLQTNDKLSDVSSKDDIMDSLEIIYNKSRDISRETNSVNTDDFTETLKSMLSSYSNLNTNVISKGLNEEIWKSVSKPKRIIVFRVLQELLTNMKKHSEATFVVLNFTRSNSEIEINYSDNGVGIDSNKQNLKNGLKNAENRIESINGVFTFETELNKGVKVKMSFGV
jgi:signal transduction histidine kinase